MKGNVEARLIPEKNCLNLVRADEQKSAQLTEHFADVLLRYKASQDIAFKSMPEEDVGAVAEESFRIFESLSLQEALDALALKMIKLR